MQRADREVIAVRNVRTGGESALEATDCRVAIARGTCARDDDRRGDIQAGFHLLCGDPGFTTLSAETNLRTGS